MAGSLFQFYLFICLQNLDKFLVDDNIFINPGIFKGILKYMNRINICSDSGVGWKEVSPLLQTNWWENNFLNNFLKIYIWGCLWICWKYVWVCFLVRCDNEKRQRNKQINCSNKIWSNRKISEPANSLVKNSISLFNHKELLKEQRFPRSTYKNKLSHFIWIACYFYSQKIKPHENINLISVFFLLIFFRSNE